MKTSSLFTISCALVFAAGMTSLRADLGTGDKNFIKDASQGGITEVELGQLAASKGKMAEVRDFGAKMVTDHGKANDELKAIAFAKGITFSDRMDPAHQKMFNTLNKLQGTKFDNEYVAMMVSAHAKDEALFAKEASSGSDSDVKAFARKTDEVVKKHLSMVQGIQAKIENMKEGSL